MTDASRKILLLAPLSGSLVPLAQVPDAVFARKMAGEGIAVMPTDSVLRAPCDGLVAHLHSASHALTLTTREGVQILLHVGIETVRLKGRGFTARVASGDSVKTGEPLIEFDLEFLERAAPSTMTMMVVSSGDMVDKYLPCLGEVEAGISPALELVLGPDAADGAEARRRAAGALARSAPVFIRCPMGLHARPAALLAANAKRFASEIRLVKGGQEGDAKSLTDIMALDVRHHDRVILTARGLDAWEAVAGLALFLESCFDTTSEDMPASAEGASSEKPDANNAFVYSGLAASPGLASGAVFQLRRQAAEPAERGSGQEREGRIFSAALAAAREELALLEKQVGDRGHSGRSAIFSAQAELLDDPSLLASARRDMASGLSAAFAWQAACASRAERLESLDNTLLACRAEDIRDVGRRVLRLLGVQSLALEEAPPGAILIAEELSPSEVAGLDPARIRGLCSIGGAATSHAFLLARSLGIPALASLEARALDLPDGTPAVLDATAGLLRINPDEEELERVRRFNEQAESKRARDLAGAMAPASTADGVFLTVAANIGSPAEAEEAGRLGAEGVGLLRSEFLFLDRAEAPSENEQAEIYRAMAESVGPERELVARTLDAGGDKPLAYLSLPPEQNPFLGLRGIRLSLRHRELFSVQLRAMLRAAPFTRLHIMFPMITELAELREARELVEREKEALGVSAPVAVGVMVEVPAAALLAENLAAEADFFSIGTNDLAQYALAVDRGHPGLAGMADGLHPAVLRLVEATVRGARKFGRWVGVCGDLAADADAVPVLLGLGVDKLSVGVGSVPPVKSLIRGLRMDRCRTLAADALTMSSADEVRRYVRLFGAGKE